MSKHFPRQRASAKPVVNRDGVKTLCGLRRPVSALFITPHEAVVEPADPNQYDGCGRCLVRMYYLGKSAGLSTEPEDFNTWTWEALGYPESLDDETFAALGEGRLTPDEESNAALALITTSRDQISAFRDLFPERYTAIFGGVEP